MSLAGYADGNRLRIGDGAALVAAAVAVAVALDLPIVEIVTIGFVERSLQSATPIALTAIGGLYAEKSGVFNIGVEGFMIFGAATAATTMWIISGGDPGQSDIWLAILASVLVSLAFAVLFAILLIRYEADQIVAGLALWFVGLGFGPFMAVLVWDSRNSPSLESIDNLAIPVLADVPVLGRILFDASPLVMITAVVAVAAWKFLNDTRYGYWIQAAGENPEALDTAGVDLTRVRYAAVIFSGVMAGLGGAVLLAQAGSFTGTGDTMVSGRGWIGIVAYLFGNYNPLGAAAAALVFGGLDMLQIQLQTVGINVPNRLVNLFPYAGVILVLTIWGSTRTPSAVGETYESEE
ncbi:ribose ABC transporter permease [Halorubrum sp. C191]|uniref:Ribose ABC transporter permease n=1 Tax=Halorubrum ezzemoulense TaxID=337243 RepID=A0A256K025_HALEZ|nr:MULTISPECIES: ABC transporter permease [Halorubrum]OYR74478.1 ribose ABC transporter permease [Halorubrum ezzemoulense]OYR74843.1 ribose ABC transporter permease [Halorubrum ezzemoulense]PHQ43831.1 ribose ABC transporter permease [Halorubrum sp. C191]